MSFRNRLTTFFILMVLVPILGIGLLGYRLIHDTGSGRAGARANGLASAASSMYASDEAEGRAAAGSIANQIAPLATSQVRAHLALVAAEAGLARITVARGGTLLADIGSRSAVAPGTVTISDQGVRTRVSVSIVTAAELAAAATGPASAIVIRQGSRQLGSTLVAPLPAGVLPSNLTVRGRRYGTYRVGGLTGFSSQPISITALSDYRASVNSTGGSEVLAVAFLIALAVLALGFAAWAGRSLNNVIKRFLTAATRLANRDFSAPVPVEGDDEFGQLAREFNRMSQQLKEHMDALGAERERLRDAILRAGRTFESNLNLQELQKLTLSTAIAGVAGSFGRLSIRPALGEPLVQVQREGTLREVSDAVLEAEASALADTSGGEAQRGDVHVLAVKLGPYGPTHQTLGLLSLGRVGEPFTQDDRELLRSLAAQAATALDNASMHMEIEQKAVTDPLTGLANHGHFQNVLALEMENVRRYQYPVALILLDLDDFKLINDTYGHPQGDLVLKQVARVLADSTREGDTAARYGGEELALILPHTDTDGALSIAERVRAHIAELSIPRLDGEGELAVTASIGVGASHQGQKEELIQVADVALYRAKRSGKNRTVCGDPASGSRTSA